MTLASKAGLRPKTKCRRSPAKGKPARAGRLPLPQSPSAGTQQFSGPGNPKSTHKKAKKKQKKHKRHASKRHHKSQHKRNADKTRRAGR